MITGRFRLSPGLLFAVALFISSWSYITSVTDYINDFMASVNRDSALPAETNKLEGFGAFFGSHLSSVCNLWKDPALTTPEIFLQLHAFRNDLDDYYKLVDEFQDITDIRELLDDDNSACQMLDLHPEGLPGIFASQQLSFTASGYVEPLLPPMRHPDFCFYRQDLMNLQYLVHDFAAMCRKLKKHSRLILVDMGASLSFHGFQQSPVIYLAELYRKFGMRFDHIYAYEITRADPNQFVEKIPKHLEAAFHWINVGVSADRESRLNPFNSILENYNSDDLIIIKLDIDNSIELPLARQLLEDKRLHNLVDQFYFEYHVHAAEMARYWQTSMAGSIQESMELFTGLRKAGVPAHFWV